METSLPTKEVFDIVVNYISRFKDKCKISLGVEGSVNQLIWRIRI